MSVEGLSEGYLGYFHHQSPRGGAPSQPSQIWLRYPLRSYGTVNSLSMKQGRRPTSSESIPGRGEPSPCLSTPCSPRQQVPLRCHKGHHRCHCRFRHRRHRCRCHRHYHHLPLLPPPSHASSSHGSRKPSLPYFAHATSIRTPATSPSPSSPPAASLATASPSAASAPAGL
jgi:hypothetical protein